ncbi:DNA-binding protein [bacterium]|nr:DNA-binding protein [bacterium]
MTYLSSLIKDASTLVLDTSVLINLHASTYGARILAALPNHALVPEIVAAELEHETSKANGEHKFISELIASQKVQIVILNDQELEIYTKLMSASPSLGDGEASTLAIAACRNLLPVIDERKGRSQVQAYCAGKVACWSLDLFQHPLVLESLGKMAATEALYMALREGRMRIHEDHCDHVVGLIGSRRALDCNSLPGYKIRRQQWQAL